ncbi:MAG: hypothetical protein EOP07_08305, partial [Proteobacteria bacterium]
MKRVRVVITGVGTISPLGMTYKDVIAAIRRGESGAVYQSAWEDKNLGLKTRVAAPCRDFEETSIDRKLRRSMSRIAMMAKAATHQAIEDA